MKNFTSHCRLVWSLSHVHMGCFSKEVLKRLSDVVKNPISASGYSPYSTGLSDRSISAMYLWNPSLSRFGGNMVPNSPSSCRKRINNVIGNAGIRKHSSVSTKFQKFIWSLWTWQLHVLIQWNKGCHNFLHFLGGFFLLHEDALHLF